MELKWLEDFVSLANTGNFSRSAEERNVTQPACWLADTSRPTVATRTGSS